MSEITSFFVFIAICVALVLLLVACTGNKETGSNGSHVQQSSGGNVTQIQGSGNIVINGNSFNSGPSIVGNNEIDEKVGKLDSFQAVQVSLPCTLSIDAGTQCGYELSCDSNLIDNIRFNIKSGCLYIDSKQGFTTQNDIFINLNVKDLQKLSVTGSADVDLLSGFNKRSFEVNIVGSGDCVFPKSDIEKLSVQISGSGDVDASKVTASSAQISISGSGDVSAHVKDSLQASIAGSGDIVYTGNPNVQSNVMGSGNVRKR